MDQRWFLEIPAWISASNMINLIRPFICILVCSAVAFSSESCQLDPTAVTMGTTPYSTSTTTVTTDGQTQVEIREFYKSVTYVSKCDDSVTTSKVGTTTIPVFKWIKSKDIINFDKIRWKFSIQYNPKSRTWIRWTMISNLLFSKYSS